ncbi:MAG TPA: HAMP domain-containing sensor histidine kinase, partial [Solirubrobacteraceae bacterium]|nr:HAMP domain-containing sensor histidine kinase [Solirubrobacteraceae bacterium]
IVVAVALFGVATVLLVRAELRSSLDRALRQRAQDVAQLAVSAPAVLTDPGALEGPGSGRQLAVQVVDSHGRILARSLTLGAQLLPEDPLETRARVSGTPGFEDISVAGRPYRVYAAPIAQAGGPAAGGAVLVASDTTDISDTVSHLGVVLALSGLGAALLAVAAAALLTRRGLRPLRRLADAAGEIERTADPSRRLPETGVADEIGRLTGVLNRMLASLETSRAGERRFLADASHELRTPVTALLGNVEYAARHGADEEVIADLQRDAARLARLVDDLLVLERSGAAQQDLEPVDLARLVSDAVAAHPDDRVVAGVVEGLEVQGEADGLARVLENLIENGLVHGPPGGRVTVSARQRGDAALLTVSDEGPGPGPEQRERIFERFWRGPDSAERPGSGLGLSIVSAIVERHGGRVTVDGSAFTVELALLRRPVPVPPSHETDTPQ